MKKINLFLIAKIVLITASVVLAGINLINFFQTFASAYLCYAVMCIGLAIVLSSYRKQRKKESQKDQ